MNNNGFGDKAPHLEMNALAIIKQGLPDSGNSSDKSLETTTLPNEALLTCPSRSPDAVACECKGVCQISLRTLMSECPNT